MHRRDQFCDAQDIDGATGHVRRASFDNEIDTAAMLSYVLVWFHHATSMLPEPWPPRTERKDKKKTTPFSVNLMRSQVVIPGCPGSSHICAVQQQGTSRAFKQCAACHCTAFHPAACQSCCRCCPGYKLGRPCQGSLMAWLPAAWSARSGRHTRWQ